MEAKDLRLIEKYEADFDKISSKEAWSKEDITMMKDLQKLMYYLEIRCAMKEGSVERGHSYDAHSYNGYGYSSGNAYDNGRSGRWSPNYGNMSGRRYYDGEKEAAIHKLHRMMDSEDNPETRSAIQNVIRELEMK